MNSIYFQLFSSLNNCLTYEQLRNIQYAKYQKLPQLPLETILLGTTWCRTNRSVSNKAVVTDLHTVERRINYR